MYTATAKFQFSCQGEVSSLKLPPVLNMCFEIEAYHHKCVLNIPMIQSDFVFRSLENEYLSVLLTLQTSQMIL